MQFDLLFLNESGVVMLRWNECTKKMKVNANIILINPQEDRKAGYTRRDREQ